VRSLRQRFNEDPLLASSLNPNSRQTACIPAYALLIHLEASVTAGDRGRDESTCAPRAILWSRRSRRILPLRSCFPASRDLALSQVVQRDRDDGLSDAPESQKDSRQFPPLGPSGSE